MNKGLKIWLCRFLAWCFVIMASHEGIFAQEAQVVTFKHTIRWLSESGFPNYFQVPEVRDSIYEHLQRDLKHFLNVEKVSLPAKVEYRVINGFGKPKNISSGSSYSKGYEIDLFSFITRETTGFAVYWSVKVVIRKDGVTTLEKEVRHDIKNSDEMTPCEFQKVLGGLFREAMGIETGYTKNIVLGEIAEKEQAIRLWFPKSTRYLLKFKYLADPSNFSSLLVSPKDTVMKLEYRNKVNFKFPHISLKPMLADMFTQTTGLGTEYTIKEKEQKRGVLEFSNGKKLEIQLNWIEEITSMTNSDEVRSHISVPLVGQLYNDTALVGSFVYEKIVKDAKEGDPFARLSQVSGPLSENLGRNTDIHRIKGTLYSKPFTAEYNAKLGWVDINSENQTLATMIFRNSNPGNSGSSNESNPSNTSPGAGAATNVATVNTKEEAKFAWYPFFVKENATTGEVINSLEIIVFLLFGMGSM